MKNSEILVRTRCNHDDNRKIRLESLKKVDSLRDIVIDGEILLNWIVKKHGNKACSGFIWSRTVTIGRMSLMG
jgi:hypothetical protein